MDEQHIRAPWATIPSRTATFSCGPRHDDTMVPLGSFASNIQREGVSIETLRYIIAFVNANWS